jgi:hypothetical protein
MRYTKNKNPRHWSDQSKSSSDKGQADHKDPQKEYHTMATRILDFGRKYKGKTIDKCDEKYLRWLVSHEKVLAERNRWASRDAKFELERRAQAVAQAETIEKIEGNANWDEWEQSMNELEARHEKEMAVKIAEHLVSTPARVDLGLKGNLSSNGGLKLMR